MVLRGMAILLAFVLASCGTITGTISFDIDTGEAASAAR